MQKTGKILIVDDEMIILRAFAMELKSEGYEVFTAHLGEEAMAIARREQPDIVFTDLVMPDCSGVRICQMIKECSPSSDVLLISGCIDEAPDEYDDFIAAGGRREWFRKPLCDNELAKMADKIMGERKI